MNIHAEIEEKKGPPIVIINISFPVPHPPTTHIHPSILPPSMHACMRSMQPFVVKVVPGKGFAAFAARPYFKGEQVWRESAIVVVFGKRPFTEEQVCALHLSITQLPPDQKKQFEDLANVFPEEEQGTEVAILRTNSFAMEDGQGSAVYPNLARINHSCFPNVRQEQDISVSGEVQMQIIASRDIEINEEINISYIDIRQTTERRREQLDMSYRFHCVCTLCKAHDSNPTMRRFFKNS